jgi:hypothetical protein
MRALTFTFLRAMRLIGIGAVGVLLAGQTEPAPTKHRPPAATSTTKYTFNWVTALITRLQQCWNVPAGTRDAAPVRFRIYFELRRNGTVAGVPRLVPGTADEGHAALVESAIRAIQQCQPYAFLPQSEYVGGWDRLDFTFDTAKARN